MSAGISFAGLSSGIDSGQIIEQLLAIDRRPAVLLENQNAIEQFKLQVLQQINTDLLAVKTSADTFSDGSAFDAFTTTSSNTDLVTASASGSTAGSFSVEVLSLAQAQSRSSQSFSSTTEDLGFSGEIVINGQTISISSSDSLIDFQGAINAADVGVTAQILQVSDTDNRMILTSTTTGSEGFSLLDASLTDVLQSLGFTGSGTSIKNSVSGGGQTDQFTSGTTVLGTLLGLTGSLSGNVTIGNKTVAIDLATMSLSDVKDAIDAAAPAGVTTSIVAEDDDDGSTRFRLQIDGTTTFLDDNNVLEAIGLLEGISGVTSAVAEVQTANVGNTTNGSDPIASNTKFKDVFGASVSDDDTISISGTDRDGNDVSGSFTVNSANMDRIQQLLDEIESVFGGAVTASVNSDGQIEVTDDTAGESQLTVSLAANNEGGGTLTFGTFSSSTLGQDAQTTEVVVGQDALFRVNGVSLTRSTNTITDALEGITLNLVSAEVGTSVTVSVAQDTAAIRSSIQSMVESFNTASSLISDQFVFNEEFQTSGPLSGDVTLLTLQSQLRSLVIDPVTGLSSDENSLSVFGVGFNRDGLLEIDNAKLNAALADDLLKVKNVLAESGSTTDSDIEFVFQTDETVAGSYDVDVTVAPEQGDVTGTTDISAGIVGDTTITITDSISGKSDTIDLLTGDTTDDVVDKINTVLASNVTEVRTGSVVNTTDGVAAVITGSTTFDSIFGAGVVADDTIDIQGTLHNNERVTGSFTITDPTTQTVDDLLSEIRSIFGGSVSTTVDANGQIQITDSEIGNSSMTLVLIERNEGGGSLDFGQIETTEEGRFAMAITASNEGGVVKLTSDAYGSDAGFTISQTVDELGIANNEYLGVDIVGTINGESGTGDGRILTGDSGNANTDGLAIRVTLTPAQLIAQGQDQGTVKIIQGVASQLSGTLSSMTDPIDGLIATREGAIEDTIEANIEQIERLEERLDLKRSTLQRQFTVMETTLAELNSMGSFLGSQLASLSAQTG